MFRKLFCVISLVVAIGCVAEPTAPKPNDVLLAERWNWSLPLGTVNPYCGPPFNPSEVCPPPELDCPHTVAFNQVATCYVSPWVGYNIQWKFVTDYGLVVNGPSNVGSWGGNMVTSGDVFVSWTIGGITYSGLYDHISVTRRTGWTWVPFVSGRAAIGTEIDQCIPPNDYEDYAGLTEAFDCNGQTPGNFFTPKSVSTTGGFTIVQAPGTGPNGGMFYMTSPNAVMLLRGQVNIAWRSDHSGFALNQDAATLCGTTAAKSIWHVNTVCFPAGSDSVQDQVNKIVIHEGKHIVAGVAAAKLPANDVHALWEPMVDVNMALLRSRASDLYRDAYFRVNDLAIVPAHQAMSPYATGAVLYKPPTSTLCSYALITGIY